MNIRDLNPSKLKYTGAGAAFLAITVIPVCENQNPIFSKWELSQMAVSQYGFYPKSELTFTIFLISAGILLTLYGFYIFDKFDLRKKPALITPYFVASFGAILAAIFPMENPYVIHVGFEPSAHMFTGAAFVGGLPIAFFVFGLLMKDKDNLLSAASIIISTLILLGYAYFLMTTESVLLIETWGMSLTVIWILLTTFYKYPKDNKSAAE